MEPGVQRVAGLQHAVPGPRDGEKAFFSFFVFFERTRNSLFFVSLRKKKNNPGLLLIGQPCQLLPSGALQRRHADQAVQEALVSFFSFSSTRGKENKEMIGKKTHQLFSKKNSLSTTQDALDGRRRLRPGRGFLRQQHSLRHARYLPVGGRDGLRRGVERDVFILSPPHFERESERGVGTERQEERRACSLSLSLSLAPTQIDILYLSIRALRGWRVES